MSDKLNTRSMTCITSARPSTSENQDLEYCRTLLRGCHIVSICAWSRREADTFRRNFTSIHKPILHEHGPPRVHDMQLCMIGLLNCLLLRLGTYVHTIRISLEQSKVRLILITGCTYKHNNIPPSTGRNVLYLAHKLLDKSNSSQGGWTVQAEKCARPMKQAASFDVLRTAEEPGEMRLQENNIRSTHEPAFGQTSNLPKGQEILVLGLKMLSLTRNSRSEDETKQRRQHQQAAANSRQFPLVFLIRLSMMRGCYCLSPGLFITSFV